MVAGAMFGHTNAAALQDRLLLWQLSQLDYVCGNAHIDLSELVDTINCMYGFVCDDEQTAVEDALVDEAGEAMPRGCRVTVLYHRLLHVPVP